MYKVTLTLFLSFFIITRGFTQFDSLAYNYAQTIDQNDIKQIIFTLANDSMQGRNTASEGQKKAETYLVNKFSSLKLNPGNGDSYVQEFSVEEKKFLNLALSIDGKEIEKDHFFSVTAIKVSELKSNTLVFAGYGINSDTYNDYEQIDAKGKAIFILEGEPINKDGLSAVNGKEKSPWYNDKKLKIEAAKQAGARVLFIVLNDFDTYKSKYEHWLDYGSMSLVESNENSVLPIIYIDRKTFQSIFQFSDKKLSAYLSKINNKGKPKSFLLKKDLILEIKRDEKGVYRTSSNILATITGTDLKDEWIIISAHYDHLGVSKGLIYNGADDNASGVTAVMEIAEAFKKAQTDGFKTRRSILFMLVSGEEKGLLGSNYYTQHPVFPFEKTMVDLNIDMVGRRDNNHSETNNYIYLIGADKLSSELQELSDNTIATYSDLEIDYTYNDENDPNRFYYRSDHYNFAKNNIPVIFYFNGTHDDYHKPTDTAEKIELDALQKRAQLVFYTAWNLANRSSMLKLD